MTSQGAHIVKIDAPSLSHFGGTPSLPVGHAWPERNGAPLGFLARLSLAELHRDAPQSWLPSSGALLFFYDLVERAYGWPCNARDSPPAPLGGTSRSGSMATRPVGPAALPRR